VIDQEATTGYGKTLLATLGKVWGSRDPGPTNFQRLHNITGLLKTLLSVDYGDDGRGVSLFGVYKDGDTGALSI
jgi:hypothetical protein